MVMDTRYLQHAVSCLVLFFPALTRGEALTDGTMGPIRNLSGQFEVTQDLGTLKGQNLFHSFQKFHVRFGESATFKGDNGIRNVISRVTGSEASEINGKLSSQIGKADFYFINPNGVVFGQGAQIDVPAAFRVSTASEIRFPDGGVFSAADPNASTLSVEKPEVYGFLGNQSGQIRMELAKLNRPAATSVELVGRDISAQSSEMNVPSGRVRLEAVGAGDVQVPVGTASENTAQGAVKLTSSKIDASGEGGGRVDVRAGNLEMAGKSTISADTRGNRNGASVDVGVQGNLNMSGGSQISASTYSGGDAGGVVVTAAALEVDGQGLFEPGIRSEAEEHSSGDAGPVMVTVANQLSLIGGGRISSSSLAYAKGNANSVEVYAGTFLIDGRGSAEQLFTGIRSQARVDDGVKVEDQEDLSHPGRNAGLVTVKVVGLLSQSDGRISSRAFTYGSAGEIKIQADELRLDRSFIASEAAYRNAGALNIDVRHLIYLKDSEVTTSVFNDGREIGIIGNGGDIGINSKVLVMESGVIRANTWATEAYGGKVNIDVDALVPSGSSLQIGWQEPLKSMRGKFGHNVIQAAAPSGESGNIEVSDVQLDLSGTIAAISTPPIDLGDMTQDFCGLSAGSSLIGSGLSGGLPPKPGEGSFNLMGRDTRNMLPQDSELRCPMPSRSLFSAP